MRVVQAFSWMIFCLCACTRCLPTVPRHSADARAPADAIFLWILIALTTRAKAFGRHYAWGEPIVELPWFGQIPGFEGGQYQNGMYPGQYGYPMMQQPMPGYAGPQIAPGYVVQQNPGHSVVIQPGINGQPPTITQVPGTVSSA